MILLSVEFDSMSVTDIMQHVIATSKYLESHLFVSVCGKVPQTIGKWIDVTEVQIVEDIVKNFTNYFNSSETYSHLFFNTVKKEWGEMLNNGRMNLITIENFVNNMWKKEPLEKQYAILTWEYKKVK